MSTAPGYGARPPQPSLRIITYNIHKGIGGLDRRYRPARIVDTLAPYDADLILLQEVDEGVPRSRGHRQVDVLGEALGFPHRAFFPNVKLRRGHYGNALLSRIPLDHTENIDLTVGIKKRRSALHARLKLQLGNRQCRLWVFNVHLGLAQFERHRQIQSLLAWQHKHRLRRSTAVIVGGDFNDVYGRLGRKLEPDGYEGIQPTQLTFPAARPLRPLDRIYLRGPLQLVHGFRSHSKMAREASDHLPLIADAVFLSKSAKRKARPQVQR